LICINDSYETTRTKKTIKNKNEDQEKRAGLDLGLCNTFTLFVDDEKTPSLTFDGKELIQYNSQKNYRINKLQRLIDEYGINGYIETPKGGFIPLYNDYQKGLKRKINDTFYWRDHYFDDVFHKMSKRVLEYCALNQITILYVSRNLSFAKQKGEIEMNKKTKQKFYQIPFGRLIEKLKEKSHHYGVKIDDRVDEAYSSKTSPFANIQEVIQQAKQAKEKEQKLSSKIYGGRREGRFFFLGGKGKNCQHIFDADCVGALNHIRLGYGENYVMSNFCLSKLTHPISIKSTEEFFNFIKSFQSGCGIVSKVHSETSEHTYNGMLKRLTKNVVQTKNDQV